MTFPLPGDSRKLWFPLSHAVVIENEVPDEAIGGLPPFPEDPDERTIVMFEISLNEFVALASSVDVGRDIAYPDVSQYIWWLWNRTLAMTFCAKMIDCIENDTDVQDALNALYSQTSLTNPMPAAVSGQELVVDTGCDYNALWGAIDNLIENMNTNNIDAQQLIESATNLGERVSLFISGIPGIGILPIDEVIGYAQALLTNDVFEAYNAADTTGYRNEIKCDLFCIAQSAGCSLTLDDVGTYFSDRLSSAWTDTLSDILIFLTTGVWTGTEINDTFYLLQVAALAKSNKFFGMLGLPSFEIYMATGTPSNDWALLCAACGLCYQWDFTVDESDWTGVNATYIAATGWSDVTDSITHTEIQYDFATPVHIENITLLADHADLFADIETDVGLAVDNQYRAAASGDEWGYHIGQSEVSWIKINLRRSLPDFADITITGVSVDMVGDEPTGGSTC